MITTFEQYKEKYIQLHHLAVQNDRVQTLIINGFSSESLVSQGENILMDYGEKLEELKTYNATAITFGQINELHKALFNYEHDTSN